MSSISDLLFDLIFFFINSYFSIINSYLFEIGTIININDRVCLVFKSMKIIFHL